MAATSNRVSHRRARPKEGGVAVVADRVSKLYPGRPAIMFPPVRSMFQRDVFKRKRSDPESEADATSRALRSRGGGPDLIEDDDDDDLDDEEEYYDEPLPPPSRARPDEDFWALKDVSFTVPPGAALGVLGPPACGKTTLLSIIGGHAYPTEGRVLVRDPVAPLPAKLTRGLKISEKGTFDFDLVFGAQMLALSRHLTKPRLREIEALAAPLLDSQGEPVRGWANRLAIATSVVVPSSVLLLEEEAVMDAEFTARIVDRVHERLRSGTAAVIASRTPGLLRELCDEILVLDEGKVADFGAAQGVLRRLEAGLGNGSAAASGGKQRPTFGPRAAQGTMWQGRKLSVPDVLTPFNEWVALLAAKLSPAGGARLKRVHTSEELQVEIELETAVPEVLVRCGVDFLPSDPEEPCIRVEAPKSLRLDEPGARPIVTRIPPGTLPADSYDVRVDAVVYNPDTRRRTVIARDAGQVRIVGEGLDDPEPPAELTDHWDGRPCRLVRGSWSLD